MGLVEIFANLSKEERKMSYSYQTDMPAEIRAERIRKRMERREWLEKDNERKEKFSDLAKIVLIIGLTILVWMAAYKVAFSAEAQPRCPLFTLLTFQQDGQLKLDYKDQRPDIIPAKEAREISKKRLTLDGEYAEIKRATDGNTGCIAYAIQTQTYQCRILVCPRR